MVRILANGDVVQDDDPRVQQRSNAGSRYGSISSQDGDHQHAGDGDAIPYHGGAQPHYQEGPTVFDTWNQKLIDIGIPRWNIGTNTIEPLMTVMCLVILLIFGFPGLLFLGVLFLIIKVSNRYNPVAQSRGGSGSARERRPHPRSAGRRLGGSE